MTTREEVPRACKRLMGVQYRQLRAISPGKDLGLCGPRYHKRRLTAFVLAGPLCGAEGLGAGQRARWLDVPPHVFMNSVNVAKAIQHRLADLEFPL